VTIVTRAVRYALLILAVLGLAAPLAATGEEAMPAKSGGSVLAIETGRGKDFLVRVDRQSFRPVSRRLALGGHAYAWSLSPDRRRLAVGVDGAHGVRIIDLRRMKRLRTIRTWSTEVRTLAWVTPRRILGWEPAGLFLLDPLARKPLPSPEVTGDVLRSRRAGDRLLLLTAPVLELGPARLVLVGADGEVRTIVLDPIKAGTRYDIVGETHVPALVLAAADRAFVVGSAGEPVADVDLQRLAVTYHEPTEERSLLARFRNWLEPAAQAKMPFLGGVRNGLWLGDGRLAVWGEDTVRVGAEAAETTPAGLRVIDTNDWTLRTIDAKAWDAAYAGGTLLASYRRDGLTAFDLDGTRRYHLFDGEALGVVATFESRAFVAFDHKPMHVLDAITGRVVGTRTSYPRLLDASFSGW
ncbi:MAG TPA: hypothetical protein VGU26_08765, partial [Gaiellaceae bacterium]|nr:hypothetical protein [Gaiellaceae bacterium]